MNEDWDSRIFLLTRSNLPLVFVRLPHEYIGAMTYGEMITTIFASKKVAPEEMAA